MGPCQECHQTGQSILQPELASCYLSHKACSRILWILPHLVMDLSQLFSFLHDLGVASHNRVKEKLKLFENRFLFPFVSEKDEFFSFNQWSFFTISHYFNFMSPLFRSSRIAMMSLGNLGLMRIKVLLLDVFLVFNVFASLHLSHANSKCLRLMELNQRDLSSHHLILAF